MRLRGESGTRMQALDLSPLEELSRDDGYRISDGSMKVDEVLGSRQIDLA